MFNKKISYLIVKYLNIFNIFFVSWVAYPNAFAQTSDLLTKTESALGVSLTRYKYDEPQYMTLKANKLGLSYMGTYVFGTTWPDPNAQWFLQTDLNYHVGSADYQSPISGNLSNTPHKYFEARALVGKDIQMDGYVLAPYVGLGYRLLYSNIGYQRDSYYSTLPIGLTHKIKMADRSQLLTSIEYMHLLRGQQKVQHPAESLNLAQSKGYGLRLSVLKRYQSWSVGPTLTYWNLGQSEVGGATQKIEPHNKTLELGLKGVYHF